jgi:2-oxoglutarate ferredoxin oxidoreductase subunit gamma
MQTRILCGGFGGQGVLLIGKLVAQAGMAEGKHVTWLPSYGPEMRGGTANVMTVVSDKPVGSPIFTQMDVLVALNHPSLEKFGPDAKKGALILINASNCGELPLDMPEVRAVRIPFTRMAEEIGNTKAANMVALGALVELTGCVAMRSIEDDLRHMLGKSKPELFEQNMEAMRRGAEKARELA